MEVANTRRAFQLSFSEFVYEPLRIRLQKNSFMFSEAWAAGIIHTFTNKRFIYQNLTPL